jgi:hypothetical protein
VEKGSGGENERVERKRESQEWYDMSGLMSGLLSVVGRGEWSMREWFPSKSSPPEEFSPPQSLGLGDLVSFLCSCVLLGSFYAWSSPAFTSSKLRCWLLTGMNSLVTPLLSFRSYFRVVNNQWEYEYVSGGGRSSRFCCIFFMAYLVMELLIGFFHYRAHVTLVMGYIHHFGYLSLCLHLLKEGRTNIIAMSLLEELPTLILAISRLGKFENSFDWSFGVSFVVTRIVFHLYCQYNMFLWRKDPRLSWYWQVYALAFVMNVYWLLAWFKSVKRRRAKLRLSKRHSYKRISHRRSKMWPQMGRIVTKSYQMSKSFHLSERLAKRRKRVTVFGIKMKQRLLSSYRRRLVLLRKAYSLQPLKQFASRTMEELEQANEGMRQRGKKLKKATENFFGKQREKFNNSKDKKNE